MGYRSEVRIAVTKEVFDEKGYHLKNDLKDCDSVTLVENDEKSFYIFSWEYVKWYDSYPDVKDMMNFLGSLDEEQYGFIRVGEESDDIEEKGFPNDFELSVRRVIEVPEGDDIKEDFFKENSLKFIEDKVKKTKKKTKSA